MTKINLGGKGLFYLMACSSPHLPEVRQELNVGADVEVKSVLLTGLLPVTCLDCFLDHLGPPVQEWCYPQ